MGDVITIPHGATAVPVKHDFNGPQLQLIRTTVAADTSPQEFNLFIEVCKRVGLDPFRKQIYAVAYNKDKPEKRKMSIITGIDGYRTVAHRSGQYRPDDKPPVIEYDDAAKDKDLNPLGIVRAIVTVFKYGPDREWHPVPGVAYWDEFAPLKDEWAENERGKRAPTGRQTLDKSSNWFRMGRVMIAKVAEAQALRRGWPEDLSGVYIAEEMAQADAQELSASAQADAFEAESMQRRIGTAGTIIIGWRAGEPNEAVPAGQMVARCDEFFAKSESVAELSAWQERNRIALKDFFARHKTDAVEVKRLLEARVEAIEAA